MDNERFPPRMSDKVVAFQEKQLRRLCNGCKAGLLRNLKLEDRYRRKKACKSERIAVAVASAASRVSNSRRCSRCRTSSMTSGRTSGSACNLVINSEDSRELEVVADFAADDASEVRRLPPAAPGRTGRRPNSGEPADSPSMRMIHSSVPQSKRLRIILRTVQSSCFIETAGHSCPIIPNGSRSTCPLTFNLHRTLPNRRRLPLPQRQPRPNPSVPSGRIRCSRSRWRSWGRCRWDSVSVSRAEPDRSKQTRPRRARRTTRARSTTRPLPLMRLGGTCRVRTICFERETFNSRYSSTNRRKTGIPCDHPPNVF